MIPKTEKALEKAFEQCRKKYISLPPQSYLDYQEEALSDLESAEKELQSNVKWAIVKAYQALFLQCTAALVKNLGIYSKDHGCLIIALLNHQIIKKEALERIHAMLEHKQTLYEEIDSIRIFRNKALYFPKTQSKLAIEDAEKLIQEVRTLSLIHI